MDSPTALILAEGLYGSTYGKTAHGLVRYSKRYKIIGVIDSNYAGLDAGYVLDGVKRDIPIFKSLDEALKLGPKPDFLIVGVATDGGLLPKTYRPYIKEALEKGIGIISGLHEFLSDDSEFSEIARRKNAEIIDVRKIYLGMRRFFTGEIEEVKAFKVVVLGTDSAIGKRTTAIMLNEELNRMGFSSVFVATGQTGWMQGAEYCALIDAMINDFVAGGIEGEVVRAWREKKPDFIIIGGQGSILHPAYPGSFEILAAAKPDAIILQHAPKRRFYDGFENYRIPSIGRFIRIVKLLSGRGIAGIALNTEKMNDEEIARYIEKYESRYKVPVAAPIKTGIRKLAESIVELKKVSASLNDYTP
ncbi:MAG: DUF1611 domain-containing protein [Candidatus Micrarchaeia archaeon]